MKRIILISIAFAIIGCNVCYSQTPGRVSLEKIQMDSLRKEVYRITGLELFYSVDKGEDTLFVSINSTNENFLKELSAQLIKKDYSLSQVGNSLFILKGVGIMSNLPDNYFSEEKSADITQEQLRALSSTDNTARSENKLYKIGDPNATPGTGRALLRGYVKNIETGEPLAGVSVYNRCVWFLQNYAAQREL